MKITAPLYFATYHVRRCYGGPEEGGWYFDAGEVWELFNDIRDRARRAYVCAAGRSCEETPVSTGLDDDEEDDMPNGCPECSRSFGPHYRGKCTH